MRRIETFEPRPAVAYALLVAMTAVWGSGMVLARGVTEHIPPIGLGFWRLTVAILVLLPLVLPHLLIQGPLLRRHLKFFTLLGILQVWPQTIVLLALNYTTAINATLLNGAQPAITAILAAMLLRDRMTWPQTLGIVLALSGIVVMVAHGDIDVVFALDFNVGDWLVLLAVVMWSLYTLKLPTVPRDFSPATVLFMVSLTGTITMTPFYIYETIYVRAMEWNAITVGTTVYMGVVISAISIFVWNMCLRAIGPQKTSIFLNLNPVFAALFAIVFLGEVLHLYHLFGAILVCGGITLVIMTGRRRVQAAKSSNA
jgi:drug/metabolite transporter (DMT)-like permease